MSRRVGAPQFAVLTPFAAKYLLGRLAEGRPVTSATIRTDALFYRQARGQAGRDLAAHLESAWLQLQASAADWTAEAAPISARGSAAAEVGGGGAESSVQADDTSTKEAAMVLGLTERRVRQLLDDGVLDGTKRDGRWRVTCQSVDAFATARAVRTEQPEEGTTT